MKKAVLALFCFAASLYSYSIVFIHMGPEIPFHLPYTIAQAYSFNPDCDLYLIANEKALATLPQDGKTIRVSCESLPRSAYHQFFRTHSKLNKTSAQGLWFYSTERFFYLEELMRTRNLTDVFHLENDVLLYADLSPLLPSFQTHYSNRIGATFEQDFRCVPGFLYIQDPEPLSQFAQFLATCTGSDDTDMITLGLFKKANQSLWIGSLPILPPEYIADHTPLTSLTNIVSEESDSYANHFEDFQSIFDAASFGIYLEGDDSRYHFTMPGKINPHSIFDPSQFQIEWEQDEKNRTFPIAIYRGKKIKINNLHMTNKESIPRYVPRYAMER